MDPVDVPRAISPPRDSRFRGAPLMGEHARVSSARARTTDRLTLRPIGPEFVDDLWQLHQDPVVVRWYGGAWSKHDAAAFCARSEWAWLHDGVGKWIAHDRDTGKLVGRGGLSRLPAGSDQMRAIAELVDDTEWAKGRLEVGWALLTPYRGRGLATEIGREALRFAADVLGSDDVIAFTERHNRASRAVMERLGLHLRGEIRSAGLIQGDDVTVHADAPFAVYATK
jgi:RimJ/RimL family protein N-acetyltransferase